MAGRKAWPSDYNGDGGNIGVRCPVCNWADHKVDYTRHVEGGNTRKRICKNCGKKGMADEIWHWELVKLRKLAALASE
jgi:hypothetical protein